MLEDCSVLAFCVDIPPPQPSGALAIKAGVTEIELVAKTQGPSRPGSYPNLGIVSDSERDHSNNLSASRSVRTCSEHSPKSHLQDEAGYKDAAYHAEEESSVLVRD